MVIVCDVAEAMQADASFVDALARLQLTARRSNCELLFRHVSDELRGLIAFMGLDEVLRLEAERDAEQREEVLGVQEESDPDDLST